MMSSRIAKSSGLSLLEMLVAVSIMAISLAMLYKASGASARQAGDVGQFQRAVMLAESLLNTKDAVDGAGWSEQGRSAGYSWSVDSSPFETDASRVDLTVPQLVLVSIKVAWSDGITPRSLQLNTLRPVRRALPGGGAP